MTEVFRTAEDPYNRVFPVALTRCVADRPDVSRASLSHEPLASESGLCASLRRILPHLALIAFDDIRAGAPRPPSPPRRPPARSPTPRPLQAAGARRLPSSARRDCVPLMARPLPGPAARAVPSPVTRAAPKKVHRRFRSRSTRVISSSRSSSFPLLGPPSFSWSELSMRYHPLNQARLLPSSAFLLLLDEVLLLCAQDATITTPAVPSVALRWSPAIAVEIQKVSGGVRLASFTSMHSRRRSAGPHLRHWDPLTLATESLKRCALCAAGGHAARQRPIDTLLSVAVRAAAQRGGYLLDAQTV